MNVERTFIPRFSALLLWVLISSVPICARTQTVSDSAFMRAQYEMTYQLDTVSFGMERKDLIVLDIGKMSPNVSAITLIKTIRFLIPLMG